MVFDQVALVQKASMHIPSSRATFKSSCKSPYKIFNFSNYLLSPDEGIGEDRFYEKKDSKKSLNIDMDLVDKLRQDFSE